MALRGPISKNTTMAAVLFLSALSLLVALFNYFEPGNGIHGTEGALLVVISTALLLIAAGVVWKRWGPGWFRAVLEVLIFLDFLGTAAAAYLLEAWLLLALIAIAFVVWLAHFLRPARSTRPSPTFG